MDIADVYFNLISEGVNLDDPRECDLARKLMIDALYRVTNDLPLTARNAAAVANKFSTGELSVVDLENERVRLWDSISGRDLTDETDVLRTRAALIVLYPPDPAETLDQVATFLTYWFRGGLSEAKLAAIIQDNYGLNCSGVQGQ